jgi:hypothetical protein
MASTPDKLLVTESFISMLLGRSEISLGDLTRFTGK